jgi:hypothetical protein
MIEESDCPDCGRSTLSVKGVTVEYSDGSEGGAEWLSCVNCGWDNKD